MTDSMGIQALVGGAAGFLVTGQERFETGPELTGDLLPEAAGGAGRFLALSEQFVANDCSTRRDSETSESNSPRNVGASTPRGREEEHEKEAQGPHGDNQEGDEEGFVHGDRIGIAGCCSVIRGRPRRQWVRIGRSGAFRGAMIRIDCRPGFRRRGDPATSSKDFGLGGRRRTSRVISGTAWATDRRGARQGLR